NLSLCLQTEKSYQLGLPQENSDDNDFINHVQTLQSAHLSAVVHRNSDNFTPETFSKNLQVHLSEKVTEADLDEEQKLSLFALLTLYQSVFSEKPGLTHLYQHKIQIAPH